MSFAPPDLCAHCRQRILAKNAVTVMYAIAANGFQVRRCCSHRCARAAKLRDARETRASEVLA